jgi:outer membrane protein OmpA-like peptidoglycan-associated protein
LRADEIRNEIVVAALIVLVVVLALRFDLVSSWLLADLPAGATTERPSAPKRAAVGTTASASRREPRQVEVPSAPASFDVARIASDGPAVFAGRAPAEWNVTILADAEPVATVTADGNGEWAVVVDRRFPPGEHRLSLTARPRGVGRELIGQSVRVTVASSAQPPLLHAGVAAASHGPTERAPSRPMPITFAYDSTDFTPIGRRGAAALSDFLREQKLASATLSGHADERGSDAYNMELSRRRLDSVARYLRESGYAGKLVLMPKGRSEPFPSPERWKLSREDALQLDRRVELRPAP